VSVTSWRITKARYSGEAFSGEGARVYGGRWNSIGNPLVYTSEHASLAVLELLVHLGSSRGLDNYVIIACSFDEGLVERIGVRKLPRNWAGSPALVDLQRMGDQWISEARSAVLEVPSAVLPIERNYLINPRHPDFSMIRFEDPEPLALDARLVD
jgi:RES domain-containing protein